MKMKTKRIAICPQMLEIVGRRYCLSDYAMSVMVWRNYHSPYWVDGKGPPLTPFCLTTVWPTLFVLLGSAGVVAMVTWVKGVTIGSGSFVLLAYLFIRGYWWPRVGLAVQWKDIYWDIHKMKLVLGLTAENVIWDELLDAAQAYLDELAADFGRDSESEEEYESSLVYFRYFFDSAIKDNADRTAHLVNVRQEEELVA